VNEQNRWVSVIRKACLGNREMRPVYHPGAFKKNKWTCCRTASNLGEPLEGKGRRDVCRGRRCVFRFLRNDRQGMLDYCERCDSSTVVEISMETKSC